MKEKDVHQDKDKQKNYCGFARFIDEYIDFEDMTELNMEFSMNLVHIRYKDGDHFCGNYPIILDKHTEFEWNIDESTIESLLDYNTMQLLYSEPFGNDIWNLSFCPNGVDELSEGQCGLYLSLIKLPYGIGGVKVEVKVIFKHDGNAFKTS